MSNEIVLSRLATLKDLANQWDKHLIKLVEAKELSQRTRSTYVSSVNRFISWAIENPHLLAENVGLEYKAAMSIHSPYSVNVWLSSVKSFFNWCVRLGYLNSNPFQSLKGSKRKGTTQKHTKQPLTDDEVRRVLSSINITTSEGIRDKAIVGLMLYCGLRTIEIHRSNYENLRTEQNKLVLDVHGKGRLSADEYVVIANNNAVQHLMDWIAIRGQQKGALFTSYSDRSNGSRLTTDSIRHIIKSYFGVAGVIGNNKSTHSLRHTAITKAIQNGAKPQKVQSMARHSNISTTMIYFHEFDRVDDPAEAYIDYGE